MGLDKKDLRVIGFVILIILTFSYLFYYDMNKRIDFGDRKVIGNIYFKNNVVQRKLDDQVVWERMDNGSPLTNKDTIRSEAFSDALIRLADGTEINIDENSMFNLDLTGDKPSLEFSGGSLQVKKGTSKESSIVIKSQGNEIDVQSGGLKLEKSANKKDLNVFVESGSTKIKKGGKEVEVESGKKAEIAEGKEIAVTRVPIRLLTPESQALFLVEPGQGSAKVPFSWTLDNGFENPVIEVSRSPQFKSNVIEQKVNGDSFTGSLTDGTFYWRIKATESATNKVEKSGEGKFFIQKEEAFRTDSPAMGLQYKYVNTPPLIGFVWTKLGTARGYLFELADNQSFSSPIKKLDTGANTISFDDLKEGSYFWRVTAFSAFPGAENKISTTMAFSIKKENTYPAPNLIRPANGSEISLEEIEKGQATIIWESNPEFSKYKYEISRDAKFGSSLVSKELPGNFVTPNWKELGQGVFFLRLKGYANDGREGEYSIASKFTIVEKKTPDEEPPPPPPPKKEEVKEKPKPPPLELGSPVNSVVEMKGKKTLDFAWQSGPGFDKYEITIYQVVGQNRRSIHRATTKSPTYSLSDLSILDEGTFSWEVLEYRDGAPAQTKKANFILTLDQLKSLRPDQIEFISPKRLYKGDKK